ncbi:MAG TPA: hypothetical protein VF017_08310 [Thermoanaerobaculia bacterium]|nr:hypothetical protein [Thermoanaerobaculia bacterium]
MQSTWTSSRSRGAWLLLAAVLLAAGPLAAADFPRTVTFRGESLDAAGQPLSGTHDLSFRYFDPAGAELFAEAIPAVTVTAGSFQVELGTGEPVGQAAYRSLEAMFAKHPQVEMEVSVDGTPFEPRLGILPAGHSLKSRLVAAGLRAEQDEEEHWKGYEKRGGATAIQSGRLAPRGTHSQVPIAEGSVWTRPYTLPIIGPRLSRAVRELPKAEERGVPKEGKEINPPRHEALFDVQGNRFGTGAPKIDDYLAESAAPGLTPAPILSFEGVNNVSGVLPPDTEAAVGPNHYVQVVNLAFSVYNKFGTRLTGPSNTNTLWAGFGGPCQTDNSGDAIFLYDRQADRFVLSQFAVAAGHQSVCFAVSQTPDPTGAYFLYEVVTPRFPDYYKVGTWPAANNNAYFFGTNSGFQGQYDVFAVDRERMLAGLAARPMQFFQSFVNLMMPADADGPVGPAASAPGILYTFRDGGEPYFSSPPADSIDIYQFDVDWTTPANTTLTLVNSITPAQGLANFNWTVCGFFVSNCIPQPGTAQGIDSASWWPMQRLVYRNFGSHETLVGSWTVDVNSTGNRAAPRWFELRNTGSGWSLFQQGTHSPDAIHRWMPSIAMDGQGNIALGYSRGDGSNFPSLYYATRDATDPLNTLQAEVQLFAGTGSQTHSAARWGDYSSMELDPADDCTFWFTTEYLAVTSSATWRTRVGTFKMPSCGGPVNNPPVVTITAPANGASFDVGTSIGFAGTATDIQDGNISANLSWTSSLNGAIGSGASFSTSALSLGSHLITASVTDSGGAPGAASITVHVVDPNSNGPQTAVYNSGLGAPSCAIAGSSCDSVALLVGRAALGPEPNQPNTIDTCVDGTAGAFHSDESNDRIMVSSVNFSDLTEGATARIDATVWAWTTPSSDALDLYYAANANSPTWVYLTTLVPGSPGQQVLSTTYTLPTGTLQAVRANFRYQGAASPCSAGTFDDHDDLVFAVKPAGGGNTPPVVTITAPATGSSFTQGTSVNFTGTATDAEDGSLTAGLAWTSSINGAIGSGGSFSTSTLSVGTHTITASVTDSGGLPDSDAITVTINPPVGSGPDIWMSFTTNTTVPGVGTAANEDVVSYDQTTGLWALEFDGSDVGLGGLVLDGLAIHPSGDLLLSFTAAATISGISVDDSDIVRFTPTSLGANTAGTFSMYFDGSDVGLTTNNEDVDAIALAADGRLIISTLGTVAATGASGADTDLLIFTGTLGDVTTGSFALHFDGSDVGLTDASSEDIDGAALTSGGNLLFSTLGLFTVTGASGDNEDVAEFSGTFGSTTSGTFTLRLDLSALGIDVSEDIGALEIVE